MANSEFKGIFIAGTDTGVGKTYVATRMAIELRAQGCRVGAYKPVCTGASSSRHGELVWDDVESLWGALDHEFPRTRVCPQCFEAPLAPPAAAADEGEQVDSDRLRTAAHWWRAHSELLLIEGVGGLLSPISDQDTVADLASDLGFPLLIVAADRLGMINQTLLTLEAADARGLRVAGVILNRPTPDTDDLSQQTNFAWLERFCCVPILGPVEHESSGLLRPDAKPDKMDWAMVAARAAASPLDPSSPPPERVRRADGPDTV